MGVFDLLGKAATKGAKKAAPFFSKADVVLDELPRNKGLGNEFLAELVKKGAKPTELKERGIDKALKDAPKMTKAEVQKIFEEKAPPKVQEKVLTSEVTDYDEWLDAKALEMYGDEFSLLTRAEQSKLKKMYVELPLTQYDKYKTPGGENYREILLKLPAFDNKRIMELEADIRRSEGYYKNYNLSAEEKAPFQAKVEELARLKEQQAAAGTPYTSSHYKQDPNLLAHIRVQDFKTPDGKKVLLVDEIQSDWHQAGRKGGYSNKYKPEELTPYTKEQAASEFGLDNSDLFWYFKTPDQVFQIPKSRFGSSDEAAQYVLNEKRTAGAVPDAPFKKNWHELAMKRVLDYAAENGYDTVAITPGRTQIDRYEEALRKNIDSLEYEPYIDESGKQMFEVAGFKKGQQVFSEEDVTPDRLQELMGKDTAQKITEGFGESLAQERPMRPEWKRIQSSDLSIGGEGMKGFYDKILPDYLNNYGKKYGAQTGQMRLPVAPADSTAVQGYSLGDEYMQGRATWSEFLQANPRAAEEFSPAFHSFDITPQMREEIKTKGQPMYGKVAMPVLEGLAVGSGAATIGSQVFDTNNEQTVQNPVHFTENPDAMLLELMQRN